MVWLTRISILDVPKYMLVDDKSINQRTQQSQRSAAEKEYPPVQNPQHGMDELPVTNC